MTTATTIRLSLPVQLSLALAVALFVVVGQLYLPVAALVGAGVAVLSALLVRNRAKALLAAFAVLVIAVKLQEREGVQSGVSVLDILTGGAIVAALGYVIVQSVVHRQRIAYHWSMYFLLAYVVWAVVGSVVSMLTDNTSINFAFRELLLFSPLLVFPILLIPVDRADRTMERSLVWILLLIWSMVQVAGILQLRSTLAVATFLYETGFSHYDIVNAGLMTILFAGLGALNRDRRRRIVYVGLILASLGGLVITFNRTAWVAVVLCLPVLVLAAPHREVRRETLAVLLRVVGYVLFGLLAAYVVLPLARVMIEYLFLRLLSTSKVGTDASLVNRYVEWRYVFSQIADNPILGVGFGGLFKIYNWVAGRSQVVGYTHNWLFILLVKGGIVGAACFITSFVGFVRIALRARRSPLLDLRERTLALVCLSGLLFVFIVGMTVGVILHREILLYVGIMWGYLLVLNDRMERRRHTPLEVEGASATP